MQAGGTQPKRWEKLISHAGSSAQIMSMKDSINGDPSWSFGESAGHFLPYHAFDFWLNLSLCHALIVDGSEGIATYQVSFCHSLCDKRGLHMDIAYHLRPFINCVLALIFSNAHRRDSFRSFACSPDLQKRASSIG